MAKLYRSLEKARCCCLDRGIMSEYKLVGHEIETPLVNAAGSVNGISREHILHNVDTLANTAIGALTLGSFTVPERVGNEDTGGLVYYHDPNTGATYNSMGLPNIGLAAAKELMPDILARAHEKGKPVIASVSPVHATPETGSTLEQVKRLVGEMLLAGADLVEVNTSCPNVVTEGGGRKPILGYDLEGMQELVEELAPWLGTFESKVGVKPPPYLTAEEKATVPELAKLFKERRVFSFMSTPNTIPGQIARNQAGQPILTVPEGKGGMSGPATKEIGREQLTMWREQLGDEIEIISTLGVDSGRELAIRRQLGATAGSGVTFLWESNNWGQAVTDMIIDWTESEEAI